MSDSIAQDIQDEAAREENNSRWRGKVAHVTHYVAGLGAAISATLAGFLANVDGATAWATLAGGVGAALAAIVTFMNPQDRAAFQYRQSADYGSSSVTRSSSLAEQTALVKQKLQSYPSG